MIQEPSIPRSQFHWTGKPQQWDSNLIPISSDKFEKVILHLGNNQDNQTGHYVITKWIMDAEKWC